MLPDEMRLWTFVIKQDCFATAAGGAYNALDIRCFYVRHFLLMQVTRC